MSWRSRSYEVLPAISVRRTELRKSLRTVTIAWMFGSVWMTFAYGAHTKSFATMLGFEDLAFGILAAVPWIAAFGQIIATIIIERTGLRKVQFIRVMTINRALWFFLPLIPLLLPIPSALAVVSMLLLVGSSRFMAALGMPAWWSWMGDLIPRRIRGRYLAQRDRWCKSTQILAAIAVGVVLDAVKISEAPETSAEQPNLMTAACVIFLVGAVFGVTDILLFRRIREVIPTVRDKPRAPAVDIRVPGLRRNGFLGMLAYAGRYALAATRQILLDPLKDRTFRSFAAYISILTFAMTVGGWYWWRLMLDHLGFSNLAAQVLFMAVGPVAGIFSARLWGKLIDRWGRRPVLLMAAGGLVVSVSPWLIAAPGTPSPQFVAEGVNWVSRNVSALWGEPADLLGPDAPVGAFILIFLNCSAAGACWSGSFMAQNAIRLGFADGAGRSKYVAAADILMSVGGIVGGLVGGVVTRLLDFMQDSPMGPFGWNNWHVAVAISMVARSVAFVVACNMPDPGAGRVRDMLRLMSINVYAAVVPRFFLPLRLIRWRRRNGNAKRRGK